MQRRKLMMVGLALGVPPRTALLLALIPAFLDVPTPRAGGATPTA